MTSEKRRRGRPKGTSISVQARKQISAMCARFGLQDEILTYRDLSAALNKKRGTKLSVGTVYRIANGYEPKSPRIRTALGLPAMGAAPVCPVHGVVHVAPRCPVERTTPAKPRIRNKRLLLMVWAAFLGNEREQEMRALDWV